MTVCVVLGLMIALFLFFNLSLRLLGEVVSTLSFHRLFSFLLVIIDHLIQNFYLSIFNLVLLNQEFFSFELLMQSFKVSFIGVEFVFKGLKLTFKLCKMGLKGIDHGVKILDDFANFIFHIRAEGLLESSFHF